MGNRFSCRRNSSKDSRFFAWILQLTIGTKPLRDWIKRRYLERDGPRQQISREELNRLVSWLANRSTSFGAEQYLSRLHRNGETQRRGFEKLRSARFVWPKGRKDLNPKELSGLVGCHPSLIIKAIRSRWQSRLGRRRTMYRWMINKRSWEDHFPLTTSLPPSNRLLPSSKKIPCHAVRGLFPENS